MLIHQISGKGAGIDVIDPDNRAECKCCLIFKAARCVPVLFSILDRKVIFSDVSDPAAGDGAAKTGFVGQQVGVSRIVSLQHRLGVDLVVAVELDFLEVVGRQTTELLHRVHHGVGAVLGQTAGLLGKQVLHLVGHLHKPLGILNPHAPCPAHRYRFQILCAHHRTDSRPASGPVQVINHGGIAHPAFSCDADGRNLQHRVVMLLFYPLIRFPDRLSPNLVRTGETDFITLNQEIHRFF